MRETTAQYLAEISRWNFSSAAWWLVDLREDPDHFICSEEMAALFDLDSGAAKHNLSNTFQTDQIAPEPLVGENANQSTFFDIQALLSDSDSDSASTHELTFKWRDPRTMGYRMFANQIRVVERSSHGLPEVLYGIVEEVSASSASHFGSLVKDQLEQMSADYGYSYRWIVDLDNMLILPDLAMAKLHGDGWVAGQWYPFSAIYDWTPKEYWPLVEEETTDFRRRIRGGAGAEIDVTHPHVHARTGETHWYNIRGRHIWLKGRNYSAGVALDVTQRRQEQELLKEQFARQELLGSNGEIAQWQFDPATGTLIYDELYCQWLNTGLKPFEPCGMDQVMSTMTQEQQQSFAVDVQTGIDLVLNQRGTDKYVWDHYVWDRVVRAIAKRSEIGGKEVVLGYSIDVSDVVKAKLEAQDLHKRLQAVAETAKVGIFDYNMINGTISVNDAFRRIYDLPSERYPQITQELIESRWEPEQSKTFRTIRDAALLDQNFSQQERTLRHSDGSIRHVSVSIHGEYVGERLVRINGSVIDHTDEILKQTQLEEMVCEREEMLRKQQQMFAIIGHELRTPVAAVQMLLEDDSTEIGDKLEQLADISDGLLNVLDDLRLVSDPGRDRQIMQKQADPKRIIEAALASLKKVLHDRSIEVQFASDPLSAPLIFPAQSLRQVVTNLVKNAALHSEGRNISVSLEYSETPFSGLLATLRVEDDGKGIPKSELNRLFEAFERGKSSQDGSGLGLYIVRTLATKMNGAVSCTQSRYGGACFTISFPVTRAKVASETGVNKKGVEERGVDLSALSLEGLRILVAEDEATLRLLTQRMLSKRGALVTTAEDGVEALERYKAGEYDLLLTDMMMPKMGGVELIQAIRQLSSDLPIIAVTAAVLGSESQQLLNAGANAVVAKPITANVLLNALESLSFD